MGHCNCVGQANSENNSVTLQPTVDIPAADNISDVLEVVFTQVHCCIENSC